jgi:FtsH-binding integral membrane protein
MAFAQATARRPIEGAVATLGVSDRVAFLRKTYAHLGVSLILFAAATGFMIKFTTEFSLRFSAWAWGGQGYQWLLVIGLFMLVNMGAQRLAMSPSSRGLQYVGLGITIAAWSFLLQPLIWFVMIKFGNAATMFAGNTVHATLSPTAASVILESVIITLAIFTGLTLTVFLTKKDFSFLRGILTICTFAALGVIVASILFGFSLGALFCGAMILLMAGYILYQTSLVMSYFPPTHYVAAALMLFGTIATLFWYVLSLVASMRDR